MSIQISVVIWTVICFLLLMVILQNLLFKPVLEVIEKRRLRIEKAKERQAEAERLSAEYKEKNDEIRLALEKEQKMLTDAEVEKINAESKKAVESARTNRLSTYETYRNECAEEYSKILATAETTTKQIAETFADRIINQPRIN